MVIKKLKCFFNCKNIKNYSYLSLSAFFYFMVKITVLKKYLFKIINYHNFQTYLLIKKWLISQKKKLKNG